MFVGKLWVAVKRTDWLLLVLKLYTVFDNFLKLSATDRNIFQDVFVAMHCSVRPTVSQSVHGVISLSGGFYSHECFPVLFCCATCALIFYIFLSCCCIRCHDLLCICDRCYRRSSSHEVKTFSMLGAVFFGLDLFLYG